MVLAVVAVMALLCGSLALAVLFGAGAYVLKGQMVQGYGAGAPASKLDVVEPVSPCLRLLYGSILLSEGVAAATLPIS